MYISQARRFIGFTARNAGSPNFYSPEQKDFALQTMGDDLARKARVIPALASFNTMSGIPNYANVLPSAFRPDRLGSVFLSGTNVTVGYGPNMYNGYQWVEGGIDGTADCYYRRTVDLDVVSVQNVQDANKLSMATAQPQCLAFTSWSSLNIAPIPDQVYSVVFRYWDFFTTWTAGVPLVHPTIASGVITALTVTDQAAVLSPNVSVYPSALTPVVITGDGTGATATAAGTYGTSLALTVTGGGSGYTTARISIAGVDVTDAVLNIPDDLMRKAIVFGGPCFLQNDDPEHAFTKDARQVFDEFILEICGNSGGYGEQEVYSTGRRR